MRTAVAIVGLVVVLAGAWLACWRAADLRHPPAVRGEPHIYLSVAGTRDGPLPPHLSQTGAFVDLRTLTPAAGLVPYDLNTPFWSDGASKRRWIALPRGEDGRPQPIRYAPTGPWSFPAGTVFIKHFELGDPPAARRVETRLLVVNEDGTVRGASYRWRDDGSDADLVAATTTEPVAFTDAAGERKQPWFFPGMHDCGTCHTAGAGNVLGVTARQLNRDYLYDGTYRENQLAFLTHHGLLASAPADPATQPALAAVDDVHRSLEDRARSWLDANCAQCHHPGPGGVVSYFDARYDTPLAKQNLIDGPVVIDQNIDHARTIAPSDPWRSLILLRVQTLGPIKMPPLAHERVDPRGVALLREWIASLPGPPVLAPPVIRATTTKSAAVTVALSNDDPAAEIRYTLDGLAPVASSPLYTAPIQITSPTTIRARAYKAGYTRSVTVTQTFTMDD